MAFKAGVFSAGSPSRERGSHGFPVQFAIVTELAAE
jgi:hypothetical protein